MKMLTTLVLSALVMACSRPQPAEPTSAIDEAKTQEVFDHHVKAFKENDMEAVMADYTENSILITPDATYRGLAEIRKNFEGAFAVLPKDSTAFAATRTVIAQDIAYFTWNAKTPKLEWTLGTDTFIIRDGKIVQQTYAGVVKEISK